MCQIKGLKDYIRYHRTNVTNKYYESREVWEKLTAKGVVRFRVNIAPTLPPDAAPSAQVTKPPPVINDPLRDWKKGIKCDMSIFKEMKKTKEWEQWDTQFRADVTTQGLRNILDPNYIPATYDDKMLFREQQHYMYAVFIRVLKMDKGKAIVRKYKGTFDAQSIYRELQEYALQSTQAVIDANTLLQYITTASLSDGTWNGTTEQFVLHWLEQVRLYEELVDASAALSDSIKLTLLTNAVHGHTKLSSVHNVAIQLPSHFGHAVDFTKYAELLLSECAQVDSALAHSPRKSGKRPVYFTDLTIDDGEGEDHHHLSSADEVDYSIDSDPVTLLANAHKLREMSANHVLMHRDQWTGVSPEGQKIWDQLSEEDKAVILKKMPTSSSTNPSHSTIRREPNSHKVNIHETSVYDFIMANAHQLDYGEQGTDVEDDTSDVEATGPPDDKAQTLHAFLASRGNDASPADLCNVLSTSPNVLQTSPIRPTPTLPTPWAIIMLTNPVPSLIEVQTVV